MIGCHSPPRNKLWQLWYIIYKIWYILKKIDTSNFQAIETLILLSMVSLFIWELIGKLLEVVLHPEQTLKPLIHP